MAETYEFKITGRFDGVNTCLERETYSIDPGAAYREAMTQISKDYKEVEIYRLTWSCRRGYKWK